MNLLYTSQMLSIGFVGLYAGAMLTEGLVLVPFWRELSAPQFFAWYAANGARLQGFFGPLTWLAGIASIAAALTALWSREPGRWAAVVAAGAVLVAVATFFIYFGRANARFTAASLSALELPGELSRWAVWHGARTFLSLVALAAAVSVPIHNGTRSDPKLGATAGRHGLSIASIPTSRPGRGIEAETVRLSACAGCQISSLVSWGDSKAS